MRDLVVLISIGPITTTEVAEGATEDATKGTTERLMTENDHERS